MDESLQELENELKALQPRRPSVLLRAQIERDLTDSPASSAPATGRPRYSSATTLRSWKWAGWRMAAGVAAVVALSFVVREAQQANPAMPSNEVALNEKHDTSEQSERGSTIDPNGADLAATNVYRPVKAANVLYDLRDEGAVLLENDVAARRVRARYVDTYTFANPARNASLKLSVPRDEVRILPASFH